MCYNWYLLGVRNSLSHTHNARSWYLLGLLFKIPNGHPCFFYMGGLSPPPPPHHLEVPTTLFYSKPIFGKKEIGCLWPNVFLIPRFLKQVLYINFIFFRKSI